MTSNSLLSLAEAIDLMRFIGTAAHLCPDEEYVWLDLTDRRGKTEMYVWADGDLPESLNVDVVAVRSPTGHIKCMGACDSVSSPYRRTKRKLITRLCLPAPTV